MDTQLFFLINGYHTPYLDQLMFLISQKAVWIPLYASLLYVVWRNYSWRGLLTVLLMVGIGMLITDCLTCLITSDEGAVTNQGFCRFYCWTVFVSKTSFLALVPFLHGLSSE